MTKCTNCPHKRDIPAINKSAPIHVILNDKMLRASRIRELIKEAQREIAMRKRVYPNSRKYTREQANAHIKEMEEILAILESLLPANERGEQQELF